MSLARWPRFCATAHHFGVPLLTALEASITVTHVSKSVFLNEARRAALFRSSGEQGRSNYDKRATCVKVVAFFASRSTNSATVSDADGLWAGQRGGRLKTFFWASHRRPA